MVIEQEDSRVGPWRIFIDDCPEIWDAANKFLGLKLKLTSTNVERLRDSSEISQFLHAVD